MCVSVWIVTVTGRRGPLPDFGLLRKGTWPGRACSQTFPRPSNPCRHLQSMPGQLCMPINKHVCVSLTFVITRTATSSSLKGTLYQLLKGKKKDVHRCIVIILYQTLNHGIYHKKVCWHCKQTLGAFRNVDKTEEQDLFLKILEEITNQRFVVWVIFVCLCLSIQCVGWDT